MIFEAISGGYGWQYFRCNPCLIHHVHSTCYMYIMYHSPHLLLFVFGAAMRGADGGIVAFVPHAASMLTICTAAPVNSYLLVYHPCLQQAGLVVCFFMAFSKLKAVLPDNPLSIRLNPNINRILINQPLLYLFQVLMYTGSILRSYLTANLPSLKASVKIYSLFSPLLVVYFQLYLKP